MLGLLSSHLSNLQRPAYDGSGTLESSQNTCPLTVPQLAPEDSLLTPNEAMSQLVAVSSSWIDLCSPDPLIADISRQVLAIEVAYAAFCGISFIVVPGPKLHHGSLHGQGLMYYARAIQEVLAVGPYIQIHIWLPMVDVPELETEQAGDLSSLARAEFLGDLMEASPLKPDLFGTWDAWDVIRKLCRYQSRLFVGKNTMNLFHILFHFVIDRFGCILISCNLPTGVISNFKYSIIITKIPTTDFSTITMAF